MNNEPVAWIIDVNMTDCNDNFIWNTGGYPDWQVKDWIPLYTHPAKTLTDEEIEYLLRESIWALGLNSDCLEQENWDDAITVFKSILRKAQEK